MSELANMIGSKVVYLKPSIRNGIYTILGSVSDHAIWIKTPLNTLLKERVSYLKLATPKEIEQGFRDE